MKIKSFCLMSALALSCGILQAQDTNVTENKAAESRAGKFDVFMSIQTINSKTVTVNNGSRELDIESSGMSGFGVSYYITEDLAVNLELMGGETEFDDNQSGVEAIDATIGMVNLNMDYYISPLGMFNNKLTPYVSAGIGCMGFSEEVDDAEDDYDSSSDFAYNFGAGLRYDFNKDIFIKGGYRMINAEIQDSDRENFGGLNLVAGWVF